MIIERDLHDHQGKSQEVQKLYHHLTSHRVKPESHREPSASLVDPRGGRKRACLDTDHHHRIYSLVEYEDFQVTNEENEVPITEILIEISDEEQQVEADENNAPQPAILFLNDVRDIVAEFKWTKDRVGRPTEVDESRSGSI